MPTPTVPAEIISFELKYFAKGSERNSTLVPFPKDQFETTLFGLKPETEYYFQVGPIEL